MLCGGFEGIGWWRVGGEWEKAQTVAEDLEVDITLNYCDAGFVWG